MRRIRNWRMMPDEKQFAALRIVYRAGYTGIFERQANSMLLKGFTPEELRGACVDAGMIRWLECVLQHTPIIASGNDK